MKKRRKSKNRYLLLLILLTCISLGYAFLTQELTINGTGEISSNSWDIHFDNVEPNPDNTYVPAVAYAATIDTSGTEISYGVFLDKPGKFYEFTVDVINNGSIDAIVDTVSNTIDNGTDIPSYLNYSATYVDGTEIEKGDLLVAYSTKTYKVRIEYKKDINAGDLPGSPEKLNFSFKVTYVQSDTTASSTIIGNKSPYSLTAGDEICFTDSDDQNQCFNFIRYVDNDAVLLAKYNLNVGPNSKGTETFIQDSDVKGAIDGTTYGTVAFSATNYWTANNYTGGVYNSTYNTAPDFSTTCGSNNCFKTPGYSIAYYVNKYASILNKKYGVNIKESRLLTKEEAELFNCSTDDYQCQSGFILNTSFYLTDEENIGDFSIYRIDLTHSYGPYDGLDLNRIIISDYDDIAGVRPVIVVDKTKLVF